jgi:hypothetical protein
MGGLGVLGFDAVDLGISALAAPRRADARRAGRPAAQRGVARRARRFNLPAAVLSISLLDELQYPSRVAYKFPGGPYTQSL